VDIGAICAAAVAAGIRIGCGCVYQLYATRSWEGRRLRWPHRGHANSPFTTTSTVVVPPDMAEHLNTDAMAVLAVIRNEAQASGKCSLPVARIAERANIGRAKARAAIRLAEGLGLIAIEDTPDRKRVIINRGVTSRC
jgi:hypothetical protein